MRAGRVPCGRSTARSCVVACAIGCPFDLVRRWHQNTTNMLATAVHAPITLTDEVENLPARSIKSLGINVPYSGTVDISLQVVRGNPLDVLVIDCARPASGRPEDQLD